MVEVTDIIIYTIACAAPDNALDVTWICANAFLVVD